MRKTTVLLSTLALTLAVPATAHADAIYGCWMQGAERLTVEYERVITPGGASPDAVIDRHAASYIAPDGERDAGARLMFQQLSDEQVARSLMDLDGHALHDEVEIWTPCRDTPTS